VIERVREERGDLAACLQQGVVLEAAVERLVVAFEAGSVFERAARAPDAMTLLAKAAAAELGGEPAVVIEGQSLGKVGLAGPTVAALDIRERESRKREAVARAKEHPRIAEAAQILGARLKEIRVPEE
jgi:hypothetical protein